MKIAIDISQVAYKHTGVGRYMYELISSLLKHDTENDYVFFFSSFRGKLDHEIKKQILQKQTLKTFFLSPQMLDILWNRLHVFPIERIIGKVDLILTSDWTEPPSRIPKMTVIHDLVALKFPETTTSLIKNTQKHRLAWVKKESQHIIADSFATKKDIFDVLQIQEEKISVVYPAVERQLPSQNLHDKTKQKYNLDKPFVLSVGKLEPRKNIKRLIRAWEKVNIPEVELLIVGPKGWDKNIQVQDTKNVRFLGTVSDAELACLYSEALFFVFPSFYEGFGYPAIEAMRFGCPVATSNTSSLKELAEGFGYLFNPEKEEEIQKAIEVLIKDASLRKTLSEKGREKASQFSKKKFVSDLIAVFHKIL